MKTTLILLLHLALLPLLAAARSLESFNDDWFFHKGSPRGAEKVDSDQSLWRSLRLPHDWAIEGPFDRKNNARCGGLLFYGTGWQGARRST